MEMKKLIEKVNAGLMMHGDEYCKCSQCPYAVGDDVLVPMCSERLARDAAKVIAYWKAKYESTLIAQPTMILHDPAPIRIEPVDVKATLKAIKAMNRMEDAAKAATEAMHEATRSVRELRKELNEFDKK